MEIKYKDYFLTFYLYVTCVLNLDIFHDFHQFYWTHIKVLEYITIFCIHSQVQYSTIICFYYWIFRNQLWSYNKEYLYWTSINISTINRTRWGQAKGQTLWEMEQQWRDLCWSRPRRARWWSAASPGTGRAWTEASSPPTSCTWREMMARRWVQIYNHVAFTLCITCVYVWIRGVHVTVFAPSKNH